LVELCTGLLFALSLTLTFDVIAIGLWWGIFSILVIITVYDLYHFIIPDFLTFMLTVLVVLSIMYEYALYPTIVSALVWQVLAALAGSAFFLFLWLVSKGTWLGFGDVKLAIPLGLMVGTTQVFSFVVLSFWIGAAVSLLIIFYLKLRRGKDPLHLPDTALTMKSAVPFAPFLVASSLTILFTHFNVLELFSFA